VCITSATLIAWLLQAFNNAMLRINFPKRSFTPCPPIIRSLSSSRPLLDFHFDTHHFVQRLEREGLNRAQAEGIMSAMAEVIDESIRNMTSNMVTKAEQEKASPLWILFV